MTLLGPGMADSLVAVCLVMLSWNGGRIGHAWLLFEGRGMLCFTLLAYVLPQSYTAAPAIVVCLQRVCACWSTQDALR